MYLLCQEDSLNPYEETVHFQIQMQIDWKYKRVFSKEANGVPAKISLEPIFSLRAKRLET